MKLDLRPGTLDLLILGTLFGGAAHGRAIAEHIHGTSKELLQVEAASLYPVLHRLEAKGWIAASWELSNKRKRAKYYYLTPLGRNKFVLEQSKWQAFARGVGLILSPVDDEGQGAKNTSVLS